MEIQLAMPGFDFQTSKRESYFECPFCQTKHTKIINVKDEFGNSWCDQCGKLIEVRWQEKK